MSDALGAINYDGNKRARFLDIPMPQERGLHGEDTARLIDAEIKRILTDAHDKARDILTDASRQARNGHAAAARGRGDGRRRAAPPAGPAALGARHLRSEDSPAADRLPVGTFRVIAGVARCGHIHDDQRRDRGARRADYLVQFVAQVSRSVVAQVFRPAGLKSCTTTVVRFYVAIVFQFFARYSAVRHASACAVSVGLRAPLVPITEAPRIPRFGASWEKPQRVDDVRLGVVAHARAAVRVRRGAHRANSALLGRHRARRPEPLRHLVLDEGGHLPLVLLVLGRDPAHGKPSGSFTSDPDRDSCPRTAASSSEGTPCSSGRRSV